MAFPRAACVVVMMALASAVANAEEHTIVIHHMELQHVEGTMRVGDTITFDNQSDMAHNLYITYEDGSVDNTDTLADRLMRERETAVVPGRFFDAPSHVRIGFGGATDALRGGLAAISAALVDRAWT